MQNPRWWTPRLLFIVLAYFAIQVAIAIGSDLRTYKPMGGIKNELNGQWLAPICFSKELLQIAKGANVGSRPGYLHAWFDRIFIPSETRVTLGLQRWKSAGVTRSTTSSEFCLLIFGCKYEEELDELRLQGILDAEDFQRVLASARELAQNKQFRNCKSLSCNH